MEKAFEELQIKDDFMFGAVMREPGFCKQFLERVLGVRISRINYPDYQKTIDLKADAKGIRLDIYVWDEEGNIYDIDMQASENKNIPKRTRYYQGMVDLNILKKGEDYKKLKRSFIIFVCTFDIFGEGRHIYTFENRCLQNPGLVLGDDTVKIILNTKGTMDDVTPELKRLLDYIDSSEPEDDYTRELEKEVESVKKDDKWRVSYMTLQMRYQEKYEEGLEQGEKIGRQKGEQIGREEGIKQSAIRMLSSGKLSNEEVAAYSGLTLEQVLEIKEDITNYE